MSTGFIVESAHTLSIAPAELANELRRLTGLALRRTGALTALNLLAALQSGSDKAELTLEPTLILWHSGLLVAEENGPLLQTLWFDHEGVMPFQFLSTQPALVGLALRPPLPALVDAQYLPWSDPKGALAWPRSLFLASRALSSGRVQRVVCTQLDHHDGLLQAQSLVVKHLVATEPVSDIRPKGLRLEVNGAHDALAEGSDSPNAGQVFAALYRILQKTKTHASEVHAPEETTLGRVGLSIKSRL